MREEREPFPKNPKDQAVPAPGWTLRNRGLTQILLLVIFLSWDPTLFAEGSQETSARRETPESSFQEFLDAKRQGSEKTPKDIRPLESPRHRMIRRIPTLPFKEDEVYHVFLGYGVTLELFFPEEVKDIVPGNEVLFTHGFDGTRAFFKGISYAVGEVTNAVVLFKSGKSLHFAVWTVEPQESDFGFRFAALSGSVFSKDRMREELDKQREELTREIKTREGNLEAVTDGLAEEKLKEKLFREERAKEKGKAKEDGLEIKNLVLTRVGSRAYLKFELKNRSKHDFPVSAVILGKGIFDPQNPAKVLGVEPLESDPPTMDSGTIPAGSAIRVLVAFSERELQRKEPLVLKVIEEGGLGRVVEFKDLKLF